MQNVFWLEFVFCACYNCQRIVSVDKTEPLDVVASVHSIVCISVSNARL